MSRGRKTPPISVRIMLVLRCGVRCDDDAVTQCACSGVHIRAFLNELKSEQNPK